VKLENNTIKIELKQGSLSEVIPASFIASTHESVSVAYLQKGANTFGYHVPAYDRTKTLIIDPTPNLAYASYYGGSQIDVGRRVSVSGTSMYITGSTLSSNSIATTGTHQSTINLMADAFVAKFTTSGTRVWGTYYGNTGQDLSIGLASATNGSVFISGQTSSASGIATTGAMSTTLSGVADAFIVKFNTSGARQWASYIGGNDIEAIHSIALNSSGDVGFCGTTGSLGMSLMPGADKQYLNGTTDAFIGVLTAQLEQEFFGLLMQGQMVMMKVIVL
jgi:hypothetical protein